LFTRYLKVMGVWLTSANLFQPSLAGLAWPASGTRHWDGFARKLAMPVRRTGLFSFAADAARSKTF